MTNVKEAMAWLSYTYLYVRMLKNPLPYGVSWQELTADPRLDGRRRDHPYMRLWFPLLALFCHGDEIPIASGLLRTIIS